MFYVPDNVTCGIKSFADDTYIYSTIKDTSDMYSSSTRMVLQVALKI